MAKNKAQKSAKPKSRPPRPDKMPRPIKYKKATGDSEPSMLEIASMRKKKNDHQEAALGFGIRAMFPAQPMRGPRRWP